MFIGKILWYVGFASKTAGLGEGSGGSFSELPAEVSQDWLIVEDERPSMGFIVLSSQYP